MTWHRNDGVEKNGVEISDDGKRIKPSGSKA